MKLVDKLPVVLHFAGLHNFLVFVVIHNARIQPALNKSWHWWLHGFFLVEAAAIFIITAGIFKTVLSVLLVHLILRVIFYRSRYANKTSLGRMGSCVKWKCTCSTSLRRKILNIFKYMSQIIALNSIPAWSFCGVVTWLNSLHVI